jgi:hypothetical protein
MYIYLALRDSANGRGTPRRAARRRARRATTRATTTRAPRADRRRFATTSRRRALDGDDGSSAREAMDIERGDDDAIDAATATVRGWLSRERETSEVSSEFSAGRSDSDGGDARDEDEDKDEDEGEDEDEDEDEDGETAFVRVEGAEIRDVEKDAEFVMREILAMQNESERVIAGKIQERVERTKGAAASVEARRAKMLQSLLSKYSRVDTSKNSHTGAIVRETTSSNPKYHFFRGTEPGKTHIEATNVGVRFRSVDAYVKAKKRAEEDRKERIAAMFRD